MKTKFTTIDTFTTGDTLPALIRREYASMREGERPPHRGGYIAVKRPPRPL